MKRYSPPSIQFMAAFAAVAMTTLTLALSIYIPANLTV